MRAAGLAVVGCMLLGGCAGASVVSRSETELVLRWDEGGSSAGTVTRQADELCGAYGFQVRRAVPVADDVAGTVHTTRYRCVLVSRSG